jgi:hypothetical protein
MFKLENVFVDDKKLPSVLLALAGLVMAPGPIAVPVINAKKGKNGPEAISNGALVSLFQKWLKTEKLSKVVASDVKSFVRSIGKAETAYTYTIRKAIEYGLLKKTGKGTKSAYLVNKVVLT